MGRRSITSTLVSALVAPLVLLSPIPASGGAEPVDTQGRVVESAQNRAGGDPLVNIELTDEEGHRTEIADPDPDPDPVESAEFAAGWENDVVLTPALGTGEFLVAGVTWSAEGDLPVDSRILVRTLEEYAWSDWFEVGVEEAPTGPDGDLLNGTEPFVTGGATAVQLRITARGSELPADLALTIIPTTPDPDTVVSVSELPEILVDPSDESRRTSTREPTAPTEIPTDVVELDVDAPSAGVPVATGGIGSAGTAVPIGLRQAAVELATDAPVTVGSSGILPAATTVTTPAGTIITREGWGADDAYTDAHWPPRYYKLEASVVHHTAGTNTYTAAQSASVVKGIFVYHSQTRGWGDIGYNFLVDKYGQIFEGRQTSIQSKPGTPANQLVEGGHALSFNRGTLGISAMGNFDITGAPSTATIISSMSRVIAWKFSAAGIDLTTKSPFLSPATRATSTYPTGTALPRIFGHGDVAATACPGSSLRTELPALRSTVQALQSANTAPVARAGSDQHVDAGETVTLDGTGSTDANADKLTYDWQQIGGTAVTIVGTTSARATFTSPDTVGDLTFRLTVSDGALTSTDTVVITVDPFVPPEVSPFTDVTPSTQFYAEIVWLREKGITTGWPDGTFRPTEPIARGAMAAFLYRLAGSPAFTAPAISSYSDVSVTTPFYKEISWLTSQGITTGFADGTFQPWAPINRDAMAAFLYRYAGKPEFSAPASSPFTDLTPTTMFYKEITWLASKGISTGYPDGTFGAAAAVNRDAMAAFLYRFATSAVPTPAPVTDPDAIMGSSALTAQRMAAYALSRNSNPKTSISMVELAQIYLDEGAVEGIRGDVAFAQAFHETGNFAFGGLALPEWNNYSGLGVTTSYDPATATEKVFTPGVTVILSASGESAGIKFSEPRLGVRAHIQHLKAYASTLPLKQSLVDPRFQYVTRGVAPTWPDLNGRWAVPGTTYGQQILSIYQAMSTS